MNDKQFEQIKKASRLPDQGLKIGDVVYSEYYQLVGRIARLSPIQEIPDNPSYVLSDMRDPSKEICFGTREHNWHHSTGGALKYNRLVKLNTWDDFPSYSTSTGEIISSVDG